MMKRVTLLLATIVGLFGLGTAVYASPLNDKATDFLDYCLSIMKNEEDPCEQKDLEEMISNETATDATDSSAHCMTEAAPNE
jgi:hypothetical protein